MGSNNADYDTAGIDAIEEYVRSGDGVVFISDANWGSDWSDASTSDQQFVDRFGVILHQDQGTYSLLRSGGECRGRIASRGRSGRGAVRGAL